MKEKYEKVLSEICYPDFPDVTVLLEALNAPGKQKWAARETESGGKCSFFF